MTTWTAKKIEDANNEKVAVGVTQMREGGAFTAMTFTASKDFKTFAGAQKWLARRGYVVEFSKPDAA